MFLSHSSLLPSSRAEYVIVLLPEYEYLHIRERIALSRREVILLLTFFFVVSSALQLHCGL